MKTAGYILLVISILLFFQLKIVNNVEFDRSENFEQNLNNFKDSMNAIMAIGALQLLLLIFAGASLIRDHRNVMRKLEIR